MNVPTVEKDLQKIAFHFHPYNFEDSEHAIEKTDKDGVKHKYLKGVASGLKVDQQGERMTESCIRSFMEQANKGDILLYPDIHGIRHTEDIGIMTQAAVQPNGDWLTEYRLYDASDQVDTKSVETADKLWRQLKGVAPYNWPRNRGFSIEGFIPDEGIIELDASGRRVIDKVLLDGVVVVPRPAYEDSIAHAVYKALGETPPWLNKQSIQGRLKEKLVDEEMKDAFFRKRWQIQDAMETLIKEAMESDEEDEGKKGRLELVFDEFKGLMVDLLMRSTGIFTPDEIASGGGSPLGLSMRKQNLFKALLESLEGLENLNQGARS